MKTNDLYIERTSRSIKIDMFKGFINEPCAIINVTNYDFSEHDDEDDEYSCATFYLNPDDIDLIIAKLRECKAYLTTIEPLPESGQAGEV